MILRLFWVFVRELVINSLRTCAFGRSCDRLHGKVQSDGLTKLVWLTLWEVLHSVLHLPWSFLILSHLQEGLSAALFACVGLRETEIVSPSFVREDHDKAAGWELGWTSARGGKKEEFCAEYSEVALCGEVYAFYQMFFLCSEFLLNLQQEIL